MRKGRVQLTLKVSAIFDVDLDGYSAGAPSPDTLDSPDDIKADIASSPLVGEGKVASVGGKPSGAKNSKTYSFVALPGNAVKKRPRRRARARRKPVH